MAEPFLGEIRLFSHDRVPQGWAACNGQLMSINQNETLFGLLGTTYGGDGKSTFALPNLQGNAPMHRGNGYVQGQMGGQATHQLTVSEIPAHQHTIMASTDVGNLSDPSANMLGSPQGKIYTTAAALTSLGSTSIANAGGGQPHENRQPFMTLNFLIALQGSFPSRD